MQVWLLGLVSETLPLLYLPPDLGCVWFSPSVGASALIMSMLGYEAWVRTPVLTLATQVW